MLNLVHFYTIHAKNLTKEHQHNAFQCLKYLN
jgi:hypothetical protein